MAVGVQKQRGERKAEECDADLQLLFPRSGGEIAGTGA
jgi:hypothetical protein